MTKCVIWKYPIKQWINEFVTIDIPFESEILSAHSQYGTLCLWVQCDPDKEKRKRKIRVLPTGREFSNHHPNVKFIGTVLFHNGALVYHVFDYGWEE